MPRLAKSKLIIKKNVCVINASTEVKMRHIWRVTLYQCKHFLASSRSVGSFVFNNPRQMMHSDCLMLF